MQNIVIAGTRDMPEVYLNAERGAGYIMGYSAGVDVFEFYERIERWIRDYAESSGRSFTLSCLLGYFNTSTSKALDRLFSTMNRTHCYSKHERQSIGLVWYYDSADEDSVETAENWMQESTWLFPRDIVPYSDETTTTIKEQLKHDTR
jgi:SiaC family regulatory phosphoprotein